MKSYKGSCHCGRVRIEADFDLAEGTRKCNCSYCVKARIWEMIIPPSAFRLLAGAEELVEYRFGDSFVHPFCRRCGTRPFGKGRVDVLGGDVVYVNLACIDDLDPAQLADAPIHYLDGRRDAWWERPAETRHL